MLELLTPPRPEHRTFYLYLRSLNLVTRILCECIETETDNPYHHRHQYYFLETLISSTLRESWSFAWKWSLYTYPWTLPIQAANRSASCYHLHTSSESSCPSPTFLLCHLHISISRDPIFPSLILQMPQPSLSTTSYHLSQTPNTQTTVQYRMLYKDIY